MYNKKVPKNEQIFCCDKCKFNTVRKSQYERHLLTLKHKNQENYNKNTTNYNKNSSYICECGKEYNHRASLYNHKKKCNYGKELNSELKVPKSSGEYIVQLLNDNDVIKNNLLRENKELRSQIDIQNKQITELLPKIGNNNTVKQRFNINLFLNEKCRDAISMDEFIAKIEVSIKDLITTRDKGLSEGLSNIIIDNMNKLSIYERPMHCTDIKRETLYIKNTEEWEKDEKRVLIDRLLKQVENKQMKNITKWTMEHPNYMEDENLQEEYIELIRKCTSNVEDCRDKVLKRVCDNVYINEK
tara:strand:- start:1804 stop:2703 length:900 start_codon:yes stop_codon:yes gene_type:complete